MAWRYFFSYFIVVVYLFSNVGTVYAQTVSSQEETVSISGTVPASPSDFQSAIALLTSGTTFTQDDVLTYRITYGSYLDAPVQLTVVSEWSQGTVAGEINPSVDILEYVIGSAGSGYNGAVPIVDTINRRITWNIPVFPANTTDRTVNFSLRLVAGYIGSQDVSFDVSTYVEGPGATTSESSVTRTYRFTPSPVPTPTPTAVPQTNPTSTPTTAPTGTPSPTPTLRPSIQPTLEPTTEPTSVPIENIIESTPSPSPTFEPNIVLNPEQTKQPAFNPNNPILEPVRNLTEFVNTITEGSFRPLEPEKIIEQVENVSDNVTTTAAVVTTIGVGTQVAASVVQPITAIAQVSNASGISVFSSIPQALNTAFLNIIDFIFGLFGFKRRRQKTVGVIFDALTDLPIQGAALALSRSDGAVRTTMSNREGRYSISVPPGEYSLLVTKQDYTFPSRFIRVPQNERHANIYLAPSTLTVTDHFYPNLAVPLDPIVAHPHPFLAWLTVQKNRISGFFSLHYFSLGFLFILISLYSLYNQVSVLNFLSCFIILTAYMFNVISTVYKKIHYGVVVDEDNNPMGKVIVQLFLQREDGQADLYSSTFVDKAGRYLLTPEDGEYILRVAYINNVKLYESKITVSEDHPFVNERIVI